jgi:hypothetical protein
MTRSFLTLGLTALLTLSACADTSSKSVALLESKDLAGWEFTTATPTDLTSVCHLGTDGVLSVDGKPVGFIATKASYENYRFHAEWRWTDKPGNSGVLVHIASGPKDRIWPLCFQVQTKNKAVGDVLPMAGATFAEKLSTPADAKTPQLNHAGSDSEKPVGEWNACDIVCRDGAIEVTINGVAQNKISKCSPAAGKVGFQLEGVPYQLRNVRIEPLK